MYKIFYHSADLDGICSAAVVLQAIIPNDYELFPIDYNDPFPWDRIQPNDTVYMVDFSLPMEDMKKLYTLRPDLVWIDHHKTALEAYDAEPDLHFAGLRNIKYAGCELCWKFLFPEKDVPRPVSLLGRYDVWEHKDPYVLPFQYGMRFLNPAPKSEYWPLLLNNDESLIEDILETGNTILRYEAQQNEMYARARAFEIGFEGVRFLACNRGLTNSKLFDSVLDEDRHGAVMAFSFGPKGWKVSMYTHREGIDVGAIAKKHGGGGHQKAAGFYCKHLPFDLGTAVWQKDR